MTFHSLFSFRANPNAETLDQFDLVAIELVDKRPTDAATGGASRPASPSGIVLSKYEKSIDHQSSVLNIVYCLFFVAHNKRCASDACTVCFCSSLFRSVTCYNAFCVCRYSVFGIVHRVRANKIEVTQSVFTVIPLTLTSILGPTLKRIRPPHSQRTGQRGHRLHTASHRLSRHIQAQVRRPSTHGIQPSV